MQKKNPISANASAFIKPLRRTGYPVKLDYNELPYSPGWLGMEDGECLYSLNRYPEDENQALPHKIAQTYGIRPDEVAVTHGVDEAVDRFIQLYAQNTFVVFRPTFFGFTDRLEANSVSFRSYDLDENFRIAEADYGALGKNDVVILASPNNPTGHVFGHAEIEKLLETVAAVFLDETYIDFSSTAGWLSRRPSNLFVYRSFSKSFGLAGLRAGFLVGSSREMEKIRKKQWFCNMSSPVIDAICKALDSNWHIQKANEIVLERARVLEAARRMGFEVLSTETNFVLVKDPSGVIENTLARQGIKVRALASLGMSSFLRISIDAPANNDLMLQALAEIPSHYHSALYGLHKLHVEWKEQPLFGAWRQGKPENPVVRKTG